MFGRESIDRRFARYCRTGDPGALGDVFDATAARLLRVARWLARDRADAEDLLQRTFLAAIETRERFEPGRPVLPWLIGLLGNQARKLRRERDRAAVLRAPLSSVEAGAEHVRDPEIEAATRELEDAVGAVREKLGEPYASVLRLHLEGGLDAGEIAARLLRPAGTVRTQLVRALDLLRRRLPRGFVAGIAAVTVVDSAAVAGVRATVLDAAHVAATGVGAIGAGAGAAAATSAALASGTAGGVATATGTAAAIGGTLMAKKVLLVLPAAALALSLAWAFAPERDAVPPPADSGAPLAAAASLSPAPPPSDSRAAPADRNPVASSESSGEPGFAAVRVRVRWKHDGAPAAGMGVQLMHSDRLEFFRREGVTDARGEVVLRHVTPGPYYLVGAVVEGFAKLELAAGEQRTVDLVTVATSRASGRVVDGDGRSVPGARIWLSQTDNWNEGWEVARSDAQGAFDVPLAGRHYLGARMDGHVPSLLRAPEASRGPHRDLLLALRGPAARVRGVVRDADGAPVPWATVILGVRGGWIMGTEKPGVNLTVPQPERRTTAADGTFAADDLAPGPVPYWAWAPGHGVAEGTLPKLVAGRTDALAITLAPSSTVRGVVRDGAGQPIAEAVVRLEPKWSHFPKPVGTSDADGAYVLTDLPAGAAVKLAVRVRSGAAIDSTLALAPGQIATWDPVLAAAPIRGKVVGPDGSPIADLQVGAVRRDYGNVQQWSDVRPDGSFELQGDARELQFRHGEVVVHVVRRAVRPGEELLVRLDVRDLPTARLRGRVLGSDGSPARGSVSLSRTDGPTGGPIPTVSLGPDGRFSFGPCPAGIWRATAWLDERVQVLLPEVVVAVGEDRVLEDFVLRPSGALELEVIDAAGKPVDSMHVTLHVPHGDCITGAAIQRGKGKTTQIQPGRYLVRVYGDGIADLLVADVEVRSGVVTRATIRGKSAVRSSVEFRDPEQADARRVVFASCTSQDGQLAAVFRTYPENERPLGTNCELAPGRHRLDGRVSDGRTFTAELLVREGVAEQTFAVDLPRR